MYTYSVPLVLSSEHARSPPCAPVQLPVYMPSEAERSDARLYAENVRKFMVRQSMFIDASTPVACVPVCSAFQDAGS